MRTNVDGMRAGSLDGMPFCVDVRGGAVPGLFSVLVASDCQSVDCWCSLRAACAPPIKNQPGTVGHHGS